MDRFEANLGPPIATAFPGTKIIGYFFQRTLKKPLKKEVEALILVVFKQTLEGNKKKSLKLRPLKHPF